VQWILAMAQSPNQDAGGSMLTFFLPLILMFAIIYFFMIRPQQKRQKEHSNMLKSLKKGDRVITSSGMYGTIWGIDDKDNKVILKFGEDLKIEFLKSAIAGKADKE